MSPQASGLIIATDAGTLRALDARDGGVRWVQDVQHPFGGPSLAQVGGLVFAVSLDGHLFALRARDGDTLWETSLPGIDYTVFDNGLRLAATSRLIVLQFGSRLLAMNPADGAPLWECSLVAGPLMVGGGLVALGASNVYLVARYIEGQLRSPDAPKVAPVRPAPIICFTSALTLPAGSVRWSTTEHVTVEPAWHGGSSLVERDGVVFACGVGVHALDATTGTLVWDQKSNSTIHVGVLGVGRSHVAVASGGYLGAYRRADGAYLWSEEARRGPGNYFEGFGAVLLPADADVLYVGRTEANPTGFQLEARDAETGALRWTWRGDSTPLRPSWRFRGTSQMLYVSTADGIHGIRASDGRDLWQADLDGDTFALLALAE